MKREPRWVAVFLKQLERTGNVRLAAERAGVDFTTAYQRRKRHVEFAERWEACLSAFRSSSSLVPQTSSGSRSPPPPSAPGLACPPDRLHASLPLPIATRQGGAEEVSRPDGKVIKANDARWGKRAEERFLTELTVSANVRLAAEAAGFSTTAVYQRRLKDQRLAAAWDAAVETGKARVQAYLVEAATRTFDPDELPIGEGDREMEKVSISQAINIAKLPSRAGGGAPGGFVRGGKGMEDRIYDETGFDTTPITRDEWEEAKVNIFNRLERLREQTEEKEQETGRCHACGQVLPALTEEENSA